MHELIWTHAPLPTVNVAADNRKAMPMLLNLPNPNCCRTDDPTHLCPRCSGAYKANALTALDSDDVMSPPPYPPVASEEETALRTSEDVLPLPRIDWEHEAALQRQHDRKNLW